MPDRIERLIIFFLSFCAFFYAYGQEKDELLISGNYADQPILTVIKDLEYRYPLDFFFRYEWIPEQSISIHFQNESVDKVMNRLLGDTGLNFVYYKNAIIIAPDKLLSQEFTRNYFITKERQNNLLGSRKWSSVNERIPVGDSSSVNVNNLVKITGIVTDQLSGDSLIGVNIYFEALEKGVSSDVNGNFSIAVPTGYNLAELSYVGYESKKVLLHVFGTGHVSLTLAPEAYELNEILITGETDDNHVQTIMMGITRLQPRQIKELPVFMGESDLIKSLVTLPGVNTAGEGAGGFNVRGGSIDQNLILQDEALIFNSSHALGFFSVFNPDVIKEATLYKSHIPAQYGGRLSSVLDVRLSGQNAEKISGKGGIGAITSRFTLEGPIKSKNSSSAGQPKTTFLAGGRITYSDWLLHQINNLNIRNSSAFFYDYNLKLSHRYSSKGSLAASFFENFDRVQFSDDFGFSWRNRAGSLIWNHFLKPDISSAFSASYSLNDNNSFEPAPINSFNRNNGLECIRFSENILITLLEDHSIQTGGEYIRYYMKPDKLSPLDEKSAVHERTVNRNDAREAGIYINDEFHLNNQISLSGGLRFNVFQQIGPGESFVYEPGLPRNLNTISDTVSYRSGEVAKTFLNLEPRLSVKYSIDLTSSVKFSYNRLNQYINLISNTMATVPIDFWLVSGPNISPPAADNFSLGYYKNFMANVWETSLEVYFRNISDLLEYKDFPDLLLNPHIETELLSGRGAGYGIELYVRKKRGRMNGWLSYSYSRTFAKANGPDFSEKINGGNWFPSRLDIPHNLNIVFNYNFNKSNSMSVGYTFHSGRPIAVPTSGYTINHVEVPNYTERNQYRIPAYHRLDFSITTRRNIIRKRRYKDSFTFSLYNVYARKNAFSVFFKKEKGEIINAYKLSVLGTLFPSFTYNFEF